MTVSKSNQILSNHRDLENISNKNIEDIKEFINTANSRLDAINSITNNSHAIAADAVTAMICENQDLSLIHIWRCRRYAVCRSWW